MARNVVGLRFVRFDVPNGGGAVQVLPPEIGPFVAQDLADCFGPQAAHGGFLRQSRVYVALPTTQHPASPVALAAVSTLFPPTIARHRRGPGSVYLYDVCTYGPWRRRGVGTRLLRTVFADLRRLAGPTQALWVVLEVDPANESALRTYARLGFEPVGRSAYRRTPTGPLLSYTVLERSVLTQDQVY